MAITKIYTISRKINITYIDISFDPNIKHISIYDDKYDNNISFSLTNEEIKDWSEFMLKYLENN
jgi:hypothetical protein